MSSVIWLEAISLVQLPGIDVTTHMSRLCDKTPVHLPWLVHYYPYLLYMPCTTGGALIVQSIPLQGSQTGLQNVPNLSRVHQFQDSVQEMQSVHVRGSQTGLFSVHQFIFNVQGRQYPCETVTCKAARLDWQFSELSVAHQALLGLQGVL